MIIQCLQHAASKHSFSMELSAGDVNSWLLGHVPFAAGQYFSTDVLIHDMAHALHWCWTRARLVHRDVKLDNMLLHAEGQQVVLCDFARSLCLKPDEAYRRTAFTGTLCYAAPEMIIDQICAPANDLWALAVCIFAAHEKLMPFEEHEEGALPDWQAGVQYRAEAWKGNERLQSLRALLEHHLFVPWQSRLDAWSLFERWSRIVEAGRPTTVNPQCSP